MANPSPKPPHSPQTQFKKGENGRVKQKGDRDRLTAKFLYELAEDFDANGADAIVKLRTEEPARYIAAVVALVPKQVEVKKDALSDLDGDKLQEAIDTLTAMLRGQQSEPEHRPALNS